MVELILHLEHIGEVDIGAISLMEKERIRSTRRFGLSLFWLVRLLKIERSRLIKAEIEIEQLVRAERYRDVAKIRLHQLQEILHSHLTDLRRLLCREEK